MVSVGVTHRIEDLRVRSHRLRTAEEVVEVVIPSGVEVVEVVDVVEVVAVVEVVVLGSSWLRTLVFRPSGWTGFTNAADTKQTRNLAWRHTVIVEEDLGVPVRSFGHWVHGAEYLSVL